MSAPYAWLIVTDHISEEGESSDVGTAGPYRASDELLTRLHEAAAAGPGRASKFPDVEWFRLFDDDGELYYEGVKTGESAYEDGFQPLDDFGTPNAGCTEIRYLNVKTGKWVGDAVNFYQVIVDGTPWVAGDGSDAWTIDAAHDMAADCERKGYTDIKVVPL